MSIAEIIPAVRALSRSEKFRLARLLLDDLAGQDLLSGIKQGQEFPLYTPEFAPGAAAQLATHPQTATRPLRPVHPRRAGTLPPPAPLPR